MRLEDERRSSLMLPCDPTDRGRTVACMGTIMARMEMCSRRRMGKQVLCMRNHR